jgi:hypothetical protein
MLRLRNQSRKNFPNVARASVLVIPAQAGNQFSLAFWFPACAGMTWLKIGMLFWTHSLSKRELAGQNLNQILEPRM